MCGSFIRNLLGGSQPEPPPIMAAPTPPPAPTPTQVVSPDKPGQPTPGPTQEDESKRKAKLSSKKVQRKKRSAGTTQLQTKKPLDGGLSGINTPQGVNTGKPGDTTGTTTTKKKA
tara:strand:- start:770 stop:1114 length:345 start_codon:yes stop_codon:yes gene_type:complete